MLTNFLLEVLAASAVSVALSGLLIWMTKTWISERLKNAIRSEYDQKLETHKAQLKAQSDVEIEKLRANLSVAATEREVRFSKLHEERAEVISTTYALLKELHFRLSDYVKIIEMSGGPSREERRKIAFDSYEKFREFYDKKLIFFPKSTATNLEKIHTELVRAFNDFTFAVDLQQPGAVDVKKWNEIFVRVGGEIKVVIGELEDEFRKLLGDEGG